MRRSGVTEKDRPLDLPQRQLVGPECLLSPHPVQSSRFACCACLLLASCSPANGRLHRIKHARPSCDSCATCSVDITTPRCQHRPAAFPVYSENLGTLSCRPFIMHVRNNDCAGRGGPNSASAGGFTGTLPGASGASEGHRGREHPASDVTGASRGSFCRRPAMPSLCKSTHPKAAFGRQAGDGGDGLHLGLGSAASSRQPYRIILRVCLRPTGPAIGGRHSRPC